MQLYPEYAKDDMMAAKSKEKSKERITITIDNDLLDWLDSNVSKKIFANRSHGFEFLIKRRMDDEK
jgi:metal-responsive CopG/Arc/MetJ family transcriptional regulator